MCLPVPLRRGHLWRTEWASTSWIRALLVSVMMRTTRLLLHGGLVLRWRAAIIRSLFSARFVQSFVVEAIAGAEPPMTHPRCQVNYLRLSLDAPQPPRQQQQQQQPPAPLRRPALPLPQLITASPVRHQAASKPQTTNYCRLSSCHLRLLRRTSMPFRSNAARCTTVNQHCSALFLLYDRFPGRRHERQRGHHYPHRHRHQQEQDTCTTPTATPTIFLRLRTASWTQGLTTTSSKGDLQKCTRRRRQPATPQLWRARALRTARSQLCSNTLVCAMLK